MIFLSLRARIDLIAVETGQISNIVFAFGEGDLLRHCTAAIRQHDGKFQWGMLREANASLAVGVESGHGLAVHFNQRTRFPCAQKQTTLFQSASMAARLMCGRRRGDR